MSQEKVARYKEEKANRQESIKKQKLKKMFYKGLAGVVCLVIVGWIGFSIYQEKQESVEEKKNAVAAEINLDAIADYTSGLTAEN